jgi:hypothetical protein
MVVTGSGAEHDAPGSERSPGLIGVLITFRRPDALADHLDVLTRQTRKLDRLVVVDNAPDPANERLLESASAAAVDREYLPLPENLGPAGGIAHGLRHVLATGGDDDWALLLDDDNPPRVDTLFESLLTFALAQRTEHDDVAGVGVIGSRLDPRRGVLVRFDDDQLVGPLRVDYVGGGQFPVLSVDALRRVGVFDEQLFFGFDDLEFGLRVRDAGLRLLIDGDLARWAREHFGRLGHNPAQPRLTQAADPWRRYYSLRNLLFILRAHGCRRAALRVTLSAGLAKSITLSVRQPRLALPYLRLTIRAVVDGWTDRLGRTVEPGAHRASVPHRRARRHVPPSPLAAAHR